MTPRMSADLHAAGIIDNRQAVWVYGDDGRIVPNPSALFDGDEPRF
jgi:hypothetical protein